MEKEVATIERVQQMEALNEALLIALESEKEVATIERVQEMVALRVIKILMVCYLTDKI